MEDGGEDLEDAHFFPDPRADPYRPSLFVQAAFKGHLDVVEHVVRRCPAPERINHEDIVQYDVLAAVHCCTALLAAAIGGHVEVARLLLEAGASTEVRDCTGATPLCEAVFHNHLDVVRLLRTDFGADVNAPNAFGWTPLHVAVDRGHREVTDYLLDKGGADLSLATPEGFTALHVAAMKGRQSVVAKLLHRSGATLSLPQAGDEGCVPSPLYLAAFHGHRGVEQLFKTVQEIPESSWSEVELLKSARHVAQMGGSLEKTLESVQVLERCMGTRCPSLFWELIQLATKLWHTIKHCSVNGVIDEEAFNSPTLNLHTVWSAIQEITTKAVGYYEKSQLSFLRRGHLLPQSVAEEVGRWGNSYLILQPLRRRDGSEVHPDYNRFTEFLLNVLTQVQDRSRALRDQYGCGEDPPLSLLIAVLRCFQSWLDVTDDPVSVGARHNAERDRLDELGRRFVSQTLHLPGEKTVLWALLEMWGNYWEYLVFPTTSLLQSLLDWGADQVINVPYGPLCDTPVQHLCRLVCTCTPLTSSFNLFHGLAPVFVDHGAHLDMVNDPGETAHAILLAGIRRGGIPREEMAQLKPPVPLSLSCLVSRKLVEWGVAQSWQLEQLLPRAVIGYVRLHERLTTVPYSLPSDY